MDNLASFANLASGTAPGSIIPCIKILRGIDIASRDERAKFSLNMTISYTSGGVIVTTPTISTLIGSTTFHQQISDQWVDVHPAQIQLSPAPDQGSAFTCNVQISIPDTTGPVACGDMDTEVLRLS